MKIIKANDPKVVKKAVAALSRGGLIVYPTETCYGLGADAINPATIKKLFKYKTRREGKPLSIAVDNADMATKYVEINPTAQNLYENHLPGPITVVSKGKGNVAPGVESEYGTLGIRIPDYPLVLEIIKKFGKPITATSANVSYKPQPYSVEALLKSLPEKQKNLIDLIIDAGELPKRETSTVVDTTLNNLNIIREGQIKFSKEGDPELSAKTISADETIEFGRMLMQKYFGELKDRAIIFALGGELGSGKTQIAKGIARQLRIKRTITSPTFTLVNEYPYQLGQQTGLFVHMDTWRLGSGRELDQLNLERYMKPGNIIAIEWADKFFKQILCLSQKDNVKCLRVKIDTVSPDIRKLSVLTQ